jgi:hypothetical protein
VRFPAHNSISFHGRESGFFTIVIPNIIGRFLCWYYGGGPCYSCRYDLPSPLLFPALYGVWFVIGSKQSRQGEWGGSKCVGEIPVGDISASCYWNQNKAPQLWLSYCGCSCGGCFSLQRILFLSLLSLEEVAVGWQESGRIGDRSLPLLLRPLQESPRSPLSWQKKIVWRWWRRERLSSEQHKREPVVSPPSLSLIQCMKAGRYFRDAESSVVVRLALFWIVAVYDYYDYRLVRCDQQSERMYCLKSRSQWPHGLGLVLRPFASWDCGFGSRQQHGCLSWVLCVVR